MNTYLDLFLSFAKVGGLTFGGGYAMLPLLQKEIVEKKKWVTDEELIDYFAIGQCTPGIIAVNTATFVGKKIKGISGSLVATAGMALPAFVVIIIIAAFIQNFADLAAVKNAFAGIRACVFVLILDAVVKLGKSALIDVPTGIIFVLIFLGSIFLSVSPFLYLIAAMAAGIALKSGKAASK